MIFVKCSKCGATLEVDENDYMPGCRDREEYYCPVCEEKVGSVFTSGIPSVRVISKEKFEEATSIIEKILHE